MTSNSTGSIKGCFRSAIGSTFSSSLVTSWLALELERVAGTLKNKRGKLERFKQKYAAEVIWCQSNTRAVSVRFPSKMKGTSKLTQTTLNLANCFGKFILEPDDDAPPTLISSMTLLFCSERATALANSVSSKTNKMFRFDGKQVQSSHAFELVLSWLGSKLTYPATIWTLYYFIQFLGTTWGLFGHLYQIILL